MKKIYLAASVLLVGGIAGAQLQSETNLRTIAPYNGETRYETNNNQDRAPGDDIVTDDFSVPANWTTPMDVNGHAWTIGTTTPADVVTYMGGMASTTAGNGHATFNGVEFLLAGSVDPQDVILNYVPTIDCTGKPAVTLEFEQRYRAFNSDQVFVEVSGNNGVSWTTWEINTAMAVNAPAIQETYVMDISAVAGNQAQVKVRFRWFEDSGDDAFGSGYGWCIDDFRLFEAFNYDQKNVASFARSGIVYVPGLDYFMVPTQQITPITFSGITTNLGGVPQTGAKFNATVDKGSNVYTGSSTPMTLAFGATDSVACTTMFTPASGLGVYDYTFWFDGTNPEEITDNDTLYSWVEVTDYTYGRDDDNLTGGINAVSSSPEGVLQIGNVMEIFANDVIGAIDVFVTNQGTNEGQLVYAQVYKFDGTDYIYVETTADYEVGSGDLGTFVKLYLLTSVPVSTGDDLLIVAGNYGGADPVEFGMAQGTDEGTVLGFVDGSAFYLSSPSAIMVRGDMRDFTGIEELENSNFTVGQNVPNPFNGTSVITYSLIEASNVSVDFIDVTGKVVKTVTPGNQQAGTYTITVDGADLAEGVYFYTFTIDGQKITKQMVVKK